MKGLIERLEVETGVTESLRMGGRVNWLKGEKKDENRIKYFWRSPDWDLNLFFDEKKKLIAWGGELPYDHPARNRDDIEFMHDGTVYVR